MLTGSGNNKSLLYLAQNHWHTTSRPFRSLRTISQWCFLQGAPATPEAKRPTARSSEVPPGAGPERARPEEAPERKEGRPPAAGSGSGAPARTFMNSSLSKQSVSGPLGRFILLFSIPPAAAASQRRDPDEVREQDAERTDSAAAATVQKAPLPPTWQRPRRGQSASAPRAGLRPPPPRGAPGRPPPPPPPRCRCCCPRAAEGGPAARAGSDRAVQAGAER